MKIDAHHHFWTYSPKEYGWIDDTMKVIRRDFGPPDLEKEIQTAGIDGVVSVQARQTLQENRFLLDFARRYDFIRGVVGWVPLTEPGVQGALEEFAGQKKAKGVRHIVQDEPDDRYILRDDFNRGVALLKDLGLVYDILIFERHLPQTLQFVDRHPDQVFVLDHIAKPRIKDGYLSPWQTNIVQLAHRPNIYCKLSGMVTEADHQNWTERELVPYIDTVLSAFGPKRVMFGSDWPVCLLACPYQRWVEIVRKHIGTLSEAEQERVLGGTAIEVYKL